MSDVHQVCVRCRAHGGRRKHLPQAVLQVHGLQEQPQVKQLLTGGGNPVL